jgi:beta-alanine--pyruvate transaminase
VVRLLLTGVDHLPHTLNIGKNAFTKGLPAEDLTLADELEKIVFLHDASNIAAVIVEPIAGSTGVHHAPQGLSQAAAEICTKHGILLIFDEVITGFGRLGSLRRPGVRRHPRHDHLRQGAHQRRHPHGGRAGAKPYL